MLQHQNLHRAVVQRAPEPALTTINGVVMSVVYVTQQPTFTGVIGGYSTNQGDDSYTSTDDSEQETATYSQGHNTASFASPTTTRSHTSASSSTTSAISRLLPTTTSAVAATAIYSSTSDQGSASNTASFGSSATDTASSTSSGGLSAGVKIGVAVGIICAIGAVCFFILLCLSRKKRRQQEQERQENEKKAISTPQVPASSEQTAAPSAPRLSLRPMSSLVPGFMGAKQENRLSQGNMLGPISEAARARNQSPLPSASPVSRPTTADKVRGGDNPFSDPENPFADPEKGLGASGAARNGPPISPISPIAAPAGSGVARTEPGNNQRSSGPTAESFPLPQSQTYAQASPATAPMQNRRPVANSRNPANPNVAYAELPGAPSPTVAQGPGPEMPQGNVYRILMDFRPTMDDELELRSGQLVRLLHEYDDGWALCIRLDRSQQGVVPRTCLAAKPSKPRPGPPPMGPASRPMTPQGRPRGPPTGPQGGPYNGPRTQSPSASRAQSPSAMSPNTGAFNQPPRPLSPGPRPQPQPQKRSMSPGPYGGANGPKPMPSVQQRRRSNSAGSLNIRSKRNSPPGPSKLGPGLPPIAPDSPGLAI